MILILVRSTLTYAESIDDDNDNDNYNDIDKDNDNYNNIDNDNNYVKEYINICGEYGIEVSPSELKKVEVINHFVADFRN